MGMFERLSRLIRANVNDAIDRSEDPEKTIDQILRDMQANLASGREQLVAMVVQEKELAAERDHAARLASEWTRKAQAAVAAGKDDLAREALRRKRDSEANLAVYEQQHAVQIQSVARLKTQLQQLEAKYARTLEQRDILVHRQRRAAVSLEMSEKLAQFSPTDPSQDLERIERRLRGQEARAAALAETAGGSWDTAFAELADPEIEAELALLKSGGDDELAAGAVASADAVLADADIAELRDFDIERELDALKGGG
jgi:phage shock protein A